MLHGASYPLGDYSNDEMTLALSEQIWREETTRVPSNTSKSS
jgi:hypothetical protein